MPARSAAAKVPKAYEEDVRKKVRPAPATSSEHFVSLDHAEPSPIMLSAQKVWRSIVALVKVSLVLGVLGAYPAAVVLSSAIDDTPIVFPNSQPWTVPGVGVANYKIAREIAGTGIAADRPVWHPQARLTALPAWQEATFSGLSEYVKTLSEMTGTANGPDNDLAAAANLLTPVPGEAVRTRVATAAEALNTFDTRASRGLALRPLPEQTLPMEFALFAAWASEDRAALSDRIHAEQDAWPASREDIAAFYAAKARAHLAHELIVAGKARAFGITADTELALQLARAEAGWKRAAELKPIFVSNQSGSEAFLPNHLATMAYYLVEAEEASAELAVRLAPPPPRVEDVAAATTTETASPVVAETAIP